MILHHCQREALITIMMLSALSHANELPEQTPIANESNSDYSHISNHQELSKALLIILQKSKDSLSACQDKQSTQAQLSTLKSLSSDMRKLQSAQLNLPEPSPVDYVSTETYMKQFHQLWTDIKAELLRIDNAKLYSKELLDILKLLP